MRQNDQWFANSRVELTRLFCWLLQFLFAYNWKRGRWSACKQIWGGWRPQAGGRVRGRPHGDLQGQQEPSPQGNCQKVRRWPKGGTLLPHITTYAPMIYTALCVIFLDAGRYIRWGSGGGGGRCWRWKSRVFWAPKIPHLMYLPASKTLRTGPYKS